jgi:hypothetical protein
MLRKREANLAKSVLEQIRALDTQKAQLLQSAKAEAFEKAKSAVDELNSLGFNYRLVEGSGGASRKGTRRIDSSRPCPICRFRTDPPHDARAHRGQESKKSFSARELEERGMTKVG